MKLSTKATLLSLFAWQAFETPICWAVWNGVIVRVFNLPRLAYWEVMVILVAIGCLFPGAHSWLLGKIADAVGED